MSFLSALDATRIADRMVDDTDEGRWARPIEVRVRPQTEAVLSSFSWWSLARNPNALLLTGMMSAVVVRDAIRAALA